MLLVLPPRLKSLPAGCQPVITDNNGIMTWLVLCCSCTVQILAGMELVLSCHRHVMYRTDQCVLGVHLHLPRMVLPNQGLGCTRLHVLAYSIKGLGPQKCDNRIFGTLTYYSLLVLPAEDAQGCLHSPIMAASGPLPGWVHHHGGGGGGARAAAGWLQEALERTTMTL